MGHLKLPKSMFKMDLNVNHLSTFHTFDAGYMVTGRDRYKCFESKYEMSLKERDIENTYSSQMLQGKFCQRTIFGKSPFVWPSANLSNNFSRLNQGTCSGAVNVPSVTFRRTILLPPPYLPKC